MIAGFVHADGDIFNAAAVICDGKLVDVYHKMYLPNYGVFDENRYFQAGRRCPVYYSPRLAQARSPMSPRKTFRRASAAIS